MGLKDQLFILVGIVLLIQSSVSACSPAPPPDHYIGAELSEMRLSNTTGSYIVDVSATGSNSTYDWINEISTIGIDIDNNAISSHEGLDQSEFNPIEYETNITSEVDWWLINETTSLVWNVTNMDRVIYSTSFNFSQMDLVAFSFYSERFNRAYLVLDSYQYNAEDPQSYVLDLSTFELQNLTVSNLGNFWLRTFTVYDSLSLLRLRVTCCLCIDSYYLVYGENYIEQIYTDSTLNNRFVVDPDLNKMVYTTRGNYYGLYLVYEITLYPYEIEMWSFTDEDLMRLAPNSSLESQSIELGINPFFMLTPIALLVIVSRSTKLQTKRIILNHKGSR